MTPAEARRLDDLEARVRALEHDKTSGCLFARASLRRADVAALATVLAPIGGVVGSAPFLARDVFESDAPALRLVLRDWNPRRLGRLFQRGAGVVVDGYVITRAGTELHATLWRVLRAGTSPDVSPRAAASLP